MIPFTPQIKISIPAKSPTPAARSARASHSPLATHKARSSHVSARILRIATSAPAPQCCLDARLRCVRECACRAFIRGRVSAGQLCMGKAMIRTPHFAGCERCATKVLRGRTRHPRRFAVTHFARVCFSFFPKLFSGGNRSSSHFALRWQHKKHELILKVYNSGRRTGCNVPTALLLQLVQLY